jgi:vesicle coat complex subunit
MWHIEHHIFDNTTTHDQDEDPYVRKTAAICVAKLYDISPEIVEDRGFLDVLRDLIADANPMVVANAVASLSEIQENTSKDIFQISAHTLYKLLAALNECSEYVHPPQIKYNDIRIYTHIHKKIYPSFLCGKSAETLCFRKLSPVF